MQNVQSSSIDSQELYFTLKSQDPNKVQLSVEEIYNEDHNKQSKSIYGLRHASNYKQQYISFFQQVEQETDLLIHQALMNNQQKLYHNLVFLNKNEKISDLISFKKPAIYIIGHTYGATIIKYEVIIGNYKISINLLNLNFQASFQIIIGKGGFGQIFFVTYAKGKSMVAKRLYFRDQLKISINKDNIYPNKQQIEEVICEYAIYNICSFYKIGPKIIHQFGFDLVCFDDCIEFYMEYCMATTKWYQKIQNQLKIDLRILHKLKIIHKDIKPQNILYSIAYQKFVLSDFGISHSVEQQVGQTTRTYQQGSFQYMSSQMRKIKQEKSQYIDLYFNDAYGLKETLQALKQSKNKVQYKDNPIVKKQKQSLKQKKQNIYQIIHFFSKIFNHSQWLADLLVTFPQDRFKQIQKFLKSIINSQIKLIISEYEVLQKLNLKCDINTNIQLKQKICYLIRVYGISQLLQEEIYFITNNDFKDLVIKKLKQQQVNTKDPKYWLNLAKLNKITSFQFKLQREITELESNEQLKSQVLLQKYFELFFKRIKKSNISSIEVINIYKKIEEQYKQREKNDTYQFAIIIFKLISNLSLNFENQILEFINKYPSKQLELLEILVTIYPTNYNTINYSLRLLKFYNRPQNIQQNWKILNNITYYYFIQNSQTKFGIFLNEFQSVVNHHKNQLNPKQPTSIQININIYLGNFQFWKYNYTGALKYYQLSLVKQKLYNGQLSNQRASILLKIGHTYFLMQKYKQAQVRLKQSLDLLKLYCSNSISYNFQIDSCYYYLIIIYFIKNNRQCFRHYLNLYLYESNNRRRQKIINYYFDYKPPIIDQQNIKNVIKQLEIKVMKNQITMQTYKQYQMMFRNHLDYYKIKVDFAKVLQKYMSPQNQYLFKSFIYQIQEIKPLLQLFYDIIIKILINQHKNTYCCLNKFLEFEQVNATLILNHQLLYQIYQCIQFRYFFSRFFNICEAYLMKQFKLLFTHKLVNRYIYWIQKVLYLTKIIKKYNLIILMSWKQFEENRIYLSVIYKNIIKFYLSRCQIKQAEIYHINYQKRKKWDLDSYSKIKKKENCMIFLCYLKMYFKQYIKHKQMRLKCYQPLESICNTIFQQKQFNVQDIKIALKILKMSKKCLFLKMRIGCLKYLKIKNLKKKINYLIIKFK